MTGAEVCLSCHVGNAQQGKVVTHEMFAAGHPPISGFEIETFPAPCRSTGSRPPSSRRRSRSSMRDQRGPDKAEAMSSTRMMIIAGLVALKDYAGLVGDNAKARAQAAAEMAWPADRPRRVRMPPSWRSTTARRATTS